MEANQIRHNAIAIIIACSAAACASSTPAQTTTITSATATAHPHAAHALLVESASCWMGGIWGDVQGETPDERTTSSRMRCEAVVRSVFGQDDHTRYLQLRAFEPTTIAAVRTTIAKRASVDPSEARNATALEGIFTKLAAADQETMIARRAAHRITRDVDHEREKLNDEEVRALPQLTASQAFDDLYRFDAGELNPEVHVLALMVLLDRMRVAQQLPVHLKPYVVAPALQVVFGGQPPSLPYDASRPLQRGGWLLYLTDVANQARHPVPDPNAPPQARHEQAIAGILEGIADQLRQNLSALGPETPLAHVTQLTIRSLEQSRDRAL